MLDKIKGKLVVSCQALEGEPLHGSEVMAKMAVAAELGGASGIRAQGVDDIIAIKKVCSLPVIGIIKRNYPDSEVFITPTMREIEELLATGCEMIALDATKRSRPNDEKLRDLVLAIKEAGVLSMADISTAEEALYAEKIGFDCVSTTLSGYTDYSPQISSVDLSLIKELYSKLSIPIIAEGRIHSPEDLREAFLAGAYSAVVGGAITRPLEITERYVSVVNEFSHNK